MSRSFPSFCACFLVTVSAVTAQSPQGDRLIRPVWSAGRSFAGPISAHYDDASDTIFVSSVARSRGMRGASFISRLSPDGKVLSARWVAGLNEPRGLTARDGTLWVADLTRLVGIDIATGKIVSRIQVRGAVHLNDVASAADGTLYVSDSTTAQVFAVKDGKSTVFLNRKEIREFPNGIAVDGRRLILGLWGDSSSRSGHLVAFDLETKTPALLTTEAVGGIDGLEPDGRGGVLATDLPGSRLLHVLASGEVRVLIRFKQSGSDIGWIAHRRLVIVPFLGTESVEAYDLGAALD